MKPLYLAVALALAATPALAQGHAMPDMKTFSTSAEVQDMIAKAKTMPPKSLISQTILSLAPYRIALEYRAGAPSAPAVHLKDAELIYVVEGSGTLLAGGTLTDQKQANPSNLSGSAISGGTPQHMAKGDFAIVPQGTPHELVPDDGTAFVLMTFHVPGVPTGWP